jgi:hypothetical protein
MRVLLPLFAVMLFGPFNSAFAGQTVALANLVPAPAEIKNSGSETILCQAEIAHWFSTDLASVAPRETVSLDLRFDRSTGTWAVINAVGEALPVERVWCGVKGRTYETRSALRLDRTQPKAIRLDCRAETSGLVCR